MTKRTGSGTDWDQVLKPGQNIFDYLIGFDAMSPKDKEDWKIERERMKRGLRPNFMRKSMLDDNENSAS